MVDILGAGVVLNNNFAIYPHQGLGNIKFGMSPQEVEAFYDLYGAPKYSRPSKSNGHQFLDQSWEKKFQLDFIDDRLEMISLNYQEKTPISLFDMDIFASQSEQFIPHIINMLGEIPLVNANEIIFKNHFLYFWGYHGFDENDKLVFVDGDEDDDYFFEKSLLLTPNDRSDDEDYSLYQPLDLNRVYDLTTLPSL